MEAEREKKWERHYFLFPVSKLGNPYFFQEVSQNLCLEKDLNEQVKTFNKIKGGKNQTSSLITQQSVLRL